MSARVGRGLIGVCSPRGIEWYRPRSVRMPVAPSSQQFESTYPGNSRTKVLITFQPAVGQRRDRVRWNPPAEGNRMVYVSKCAHGYRGQQNEKGRYLRGQMSARVKNGLIGVRSPRGVEWYRFQSVRMATEVSRVKKADTSAGRCPPESGSVLLDYARRGESNGIGLEESAWL